MTSNFEDLGDRRQSFKGLIRFLWPLFKPYRLHLLAVAVMVICFVTTGRALAFVFQRIIDQGIATKDFDLVWLLAIVYFGLDLVRSLVGFCQSYWMQRLGNRVLFDLRAQVLGHIQRLPMKFLDRTAVGRLVTRVANDTASVGEIFTGGFTDIVVNIAEMISIVVALMLVSLKLTVVVLILAPVSVVISLRISAKIRGLFLTSKKVMATINAFTAEQLGGLSVLQSFGRESVSQSHFERHSRDFKDLQVKTVRHFALLWPVVEAFNLGSITISLLIGGLFYQALNLSVGELSAYILLLQSFFRPLRGLLERFNQMQNGLSSSDRIVALLREPKELELESLGRNDEETAKQYGKKNAANFTLSGLSPESFGGEREAIGPKLWKDESWALDRRQNYSRIRGEILFENVRFRYDDNEPWVLSGLNLKIPAGKSTALVGRTGSGKTTCTALIQKLYVGYQGLITLDGIPLSQWSSRQLRERVGLILQDPFLFRGSLRENIVMGAVETPDARVLEALEHVGLARAGFNLDSPVVEKGENLSSGEKQLISFARVLLKDPDVLILDEATSHVDSLTESRLQAITAEILKGRTSVIIAHRLSTIKNCDQIAVLDQGQVLELGAHEALLAREGPYARLVASMN